MEVKLSVVLVATALACYQPLSQAADLGTVRQDSIIKLEAEHKTPEEARGLGIYKKQFLQDVGWHSLEVQLDMLLIDAGGHESRRKVIKREIEDPTVPDKTLGIFLEPADVRGTVMLTFEQPYGSDEQWLYLPALKRTKKINAENKAGSFLGTEFSWEDISTRELTKYHYRYLRDDGNDWVVERKPTYQFSGYSRQVTWVDKDNYQTVKIEYYDQKDELLKTQVLGKWAQFGGSYWRPLHLEMTNHITHKKTVMELSPYVMGVGFDKTMFSSLGLDQIQLSAAAASGK
jgi:outer membrane lipoprotein-sorting protein